MGAAAGARVAHGVAVVGPSGLAGDDVQVDPLVEPSEVQRRRHHAVAQGLHGQHRFDGASGSKGVAQGSFWRVHGGTTGAEHLLQRGGLDEIAVDGARGVSVDEVDVVGGEARQLDRSRQGLGFLFRTGIGTQRVVSVGGGRRAE